MAYKLKGSATSVDTTATNLELATMVFVYNDNADDVVITIAGSGSPYAGSIHIPTKGTMTIAKQGTDTIACATACMCTSVASHW